MPPPDGPGHAADTMASSAAVTLSSRSGEVLATVHSATSAAAAGTLAATAAVLDPVFSISVPPAAVAGSFHELTRLRCDRLRASSGNGMSHGSGASFICRLTVLLESGLVASRPTSEPNASGRMPPIGLGPFPQNAAESRDDPSALPTSSPTDVVRCMATAGSREQIRGFFE